MKFIKESFIPENNVSLVLVDKRIPKNIEKNLNKLNIKVIKSTEICEVYDAIKFHPDIALLKLDYQNIIVCPNVYDYYKNVLSSFGFNVIKGSSHIENKYPKNVAYNVTLLDKFAICNFKFVDKVILDFIEKNNFTKININQGYSKCNICVVDKNSIITSDVGIYNEVIKYGIDCLLIKNKFIDLFELDYGFIGGCSGLISNNDLAFFGDITLHPSYKEIYEFTKSKNKNLVSLGKNKLIDLGSLITLKTKAT